jgi:hypothetical protein
MPLLWRPTQIEGFAEDIPTRARQLEAHRNFTSVILRSISRESGLADLVHQRAIFVCELQP